MITSPREVVEKSLNVACNIKAVSRRTDRKPARITFEFEYPSYLKCSTDLADDLINKLLSQMLGGDIQIKGLRLLWFENGG